MPFTFLSHQAVVLPLKLRAPRAVSGTALVLGSIAPDVEYFLRTYPTGTVGHTWIGQLTFCLPVTLVLYWIVTRIVARPLAVHLPDGGDLRLSEYALLREQPAGARQWLTVATSAIIGSVSHVVLDKLSGGWSSRAATHFGSWLPYSALGSDAAWVAFKLSTWFVLAAVTLLIMQHIGRHMLIRRWVVERGVASGSPAPSAWRTTVAAAADTGDREQRAGRRRPGMFWGMIWAAWLAGGLLGASYRRSGFFLDQPATWVHIGLCATSGAFVGLVLASIAWNRGARAMTSLRGDHW